MKNPFQYGKVAENENFIDRDKDRSFLKQALYSGTNVIMVSPRRWGKSSLVKRAMRELLESKPDVKVCFIDAYPIRSSAEFYTVFAKEVLKATSSHWQQIMDSASKFLRSISPKLSFGPDPMNEFTLSFDFGKPYEDVSDILNLPEKIAQEKNLQVIVCIDEFQHLAKFKDYSVLESQLRTVWQHQQSTSYCLYGSQRHMMSEIFTRPEKPFYRFGQLYYLPKIEAVEWVPYIINRFEVTGKYIDEHLALRIVETVERHSWYVQQLASAVWNFSNITASEDDFEKALTWCVDVNSESYYNICEMLTEKQINLLKAIASGEPRLSTSNVIQKYHLGTSALITKNKQALLKSDILVKTSSHIDFQDPLFRIWFSERMLEVRC